LGDLFERDRRHVALTPAGEAFLGPARAAVTNANAAKALALRAVRGDVGQLRLGFTVIAFYYGVCRKSCEPSAPGFLTLLSNSRR
jgi:DNA-binding transcriptional LysR family regulator